jgi:hypothetical protein
MVDIYPPAKQREALLKLVEALGCRDACLRRDECGDWRIVGRFGHIYAIPGTVDRPGVEGFQIYFRGAAEFEEPPKGSKAWAFAKKAMPFCELTNDGDDEGMLFLDRLPAPEEAEIIRDKLHIAKKREVSAGELERLRAMSLEHGFKKPSIVVEEETGKKPSLGVEMVSKGPEEAGSVCVEEKETLPAEQKRTDEVSK